jgi:hypothetical protein
MGGIPPNHALDGRVERWAVPCSTSWGHWFEPCTADFAAARGAAARFRGSPGFP